MTKLLCVFWVVFAVGRALQFVIQRPPLLGVRLFSLALMLYGGVSFFLGSEFPGREVPVWGSVPAWRGTQGTYIVPLVSSQRVQIYDSAGHFVEAIQVPAGGGSFWTTVTPQDEINILTARGHQFLVYDARGQLKTSSDGSQLVPAEAHPTDQYAGQASIVWAPLSNPFWAWTLAAVGIITLRILDKRA